MIAFRLRFRGVRLHLNHLLVILWLFLLIFPKGDFKIGPIPLTWGYFLLGALSCITAFRSHFRCHEQHFQAFLLTIPFQLICMASFLIFGVEDRAFFLPFVLSFFMFPWIFFILFSEFIETLDFQLLSKLLKQGVFFVALYGIFLFAFKQTTGRFIEIPFLTVNFHDLGTIELKHINRGGVFKLISTYNNGNIYGVCMLMLLPLYLLLERSIWKKTTVIFALVLSLSRTVWLGLLFSELITSMFGNLKPAYGKLLKGSLLAFLVISSVLYFFQFNMNFLFDSNLGGRTSQLQALQSIHLLPNKPFCGIWEMVYLSMLSNFGVIGLSAYLLCLASPFFLACTQLPLSISHKRILCGLANFLFISISDGALLYIPVLVFYWFLSALVLRRSLKMDDPLEFQDIR